ncbi:unnamed protein product [Ranitomeya imitator]|uniref:ATP-dependent DNA helicase n=1 Tax=Ranitomeya imitator TaxID=111125 RepID=A0ABN9MFK5_9NEOB|nr:unnamed protein product [Ranitomeya imitator]
MQGLKAGTPVILPSTFIRSPRAMQQNYQDAMTIVRKFGKPDWKEITENLEPWQRSEFRPDLVAQVFKFKLKAVLNEILRKHIFGHVVAYVHENKLRDKEIIEDLVSAEIPNETANPKLHEAAMKHMIHGPCGKDQPGAICMTDGQCAKKFSKEFNTETNPNVDGYPQCHRRNTGKTRRGMQEIDNRWVVPYNPYLLLKYNCHINVEICASIKSVKYLFKYVYKGHDCANIKFDTLNWNEPAMSLDSRYISAPEGMWRIRKNKIHDASHTIKRLAVHLENMQQVFFEDSNVDMVILDSKASTLQAYFELNRVDASAHQYLYISLTDGKLYYLRLLLLHVRGAKSYADLRTVNGVVHDTYKNACIDLHLLEDDSQWEDGITNAIVFQMPYQLSKLFAIICVYGEAAKPLALWQKYKTEFMEDYTRRYTPEIAEQLALRDINEVLLSNKKSCADYELPTPVNVPDEILDQLNYAVRKQEAGQLKTTLNEAQKSAFHAIMQAVNTASQPDDTSSHWIFWTAQEAMGRHFCTTASRRHYKQKRTSAGLVATLLQNGSTYHSKFGLGITTNETAVSKIKPTSLQAKELRESSVVIWDEVTMTPCFNMNAVDNLFQDIWSAPRHRATRSRYRASSGSVLELSRWLYPSVILQRPDLWGAAHTVCGKKRPFDGKVFINGGDFRQTLPIVEGGKRAQIVMSTIKYSKFWNQFSRFQLQKNMRTSQDEVEYNSWLLKLANGELSNVYGLPEDTIEIPNSFIEEGDLITAIFGDSIEITNATSIWQCEGLCFAGQVVLLNDTIGFSTSCTGKREKNSKFREHEVKPLEKWRKKEPNHGWSQVDCPLVARNCALLQFPKLFCKEHEVKPLEKWRKNEPNHGWSQVDCPLVARNCALLQFPKLFCKEHEVKPLERRRKNEPNHGWSQVDCPLVARNCALLQFPKLFCKEGVIQLKSNYTFK